MSNVKTNFRSVLNYLNIDLKFIKRELPSIVFILFSIFLGLLYIKNIGNLIGPDIHSAHYKASLATATGQVFKSPINIEYGKRHLIEGEGRYFQSGGKDCIGGAFVSIIIKNPIKTDGMSGCVRNHDKGLKEDVGVTDAILQYPFVAYIPQALGLWIGMSLDLEPVNAQTLARIFNLIVYILIICISIQLLPKRGRWLAVFLASLPPSLFLASSMSADGLNIAWSFLFISYVINLHIKGVCATRRQYLILFLLGVTLFLLKVAYVPIVLLIMGLAGRVMPFRRSLTLLLTTVVIGSILYIGWSTNWGSLNAVVDTSDNMKIMLSNLPKVFVGVMANVLLVPTIIFRLDDGMYVFLLIIAILISLALIRDVKHPKVDRLFDFVAIYKLQILAILAAIMSISMTYAALLLTWTDIGAHGFMDIQGFQGRYVLPLLPLLLTLTCLPESRKTKKLKTNVR